MTWEHSCCNRVDTRMGFSVNIFLVSYVLLFNSSMYVGSHFLTYATIPVVKASRVFIVGQHTLV
jgi:hypothetical protein